MTNRVVKVIGGVDTHKRTHYAAVIDDNGRQLGHRERNDAESINRNLDDTLWLRRAHSVGHERQLLNLLGYALMVNGLALHRHRRRHPTTLAA